MKYSTNVVLLGMTSSKGSVDGNAYDNTKINVMMEARELNGNASGRGHGYQAVAMKHGDSTNFDKLLVRQKIAFPCNAVIEVDEVAAGNDRFEKMITNVKFVSQIPLDVRQPAQKSN